MTNNPKIRKGRPRKIHSPSIGPAELVQSPKHNGARRATGLAPRKLEVSADALPVGLKPKIEETAVSIHAFLEHASRPLTEMMPEKWTLLRIAQAAFFLTMTDQRAYRRRREAIRLLKRDLEKVQRKPEIVLQWTVMKALLLHGKQLDKLATFTPNRAFWVAVTSESLQQLPSMLNSPNFNSYIERHLLMAAAMLDCFDHSGVALVKIHKGGLWQARRARRAVDENTIVDHIILDLKNCGMKVPAKFKRAAAARAIQGCLKHRNDYKFLALHRFLGRNII